MDLAKYAALFLAESREHLTSCNQLLLQWEREPASTEPVRGLFRAIHTIKGMGATMGYDGVADLAHLIESLLDALRQGRVTPGPDVLQLLFRAVDLLSAVVDASAAAKPAPEDPGLAQELERVAAGGGIETLPVAARARDAGGPPQRRAGDRPRQRGVQVVIRPEAVMRGARAVLAIRRVESLGTVSGLRPPLVQLERDDFDGRFSFRLETRAAEPEIVAAITSAGDVQTVRLDEPGAAGPGLVDRRRQIRVDLQRLDALMQQVGELVAAKNRLGVLTAGSDMTGLPEVSERIGRLVTGIQADVIAARMTPVGEVFERFPRLVRDLARELGKRIRFDLEGEDIELDRSILDEIGDPLLHLIRNAADHGIEPPESRAELGKPPEGRILLSASRERNSVLIRVVDDGRGIDRVAVVAKARREELADASPEALTDEVLLRVIARPGFTTAPSLSGVSGRGVGVDAAMTRVRALGGTLEVRSTPGKGTTFMIRVPLTLAIVRALLADAGGERYAVPLGYVAETVEFDPRAVTALRSREALVVRQRVIPTVHLRDLVAVAGQAPGARRPTVIIELGDRRAALVVDALLGQQDIIIAPFDAPRGMPPYVGGATILADGAPALVLDAAALL